MLPESQCGFRRHRGTTDVGISLLSIAGKIFARILLNRLNGQGPAPGKPMWLPPTPRNNRYDLCARQLQETCQEMRTHLYTTFVDLMKAFYTVNRDGMGKVLQKFCCPERFTQRHDGMTSSVSDNGTVSEAFAMTNGVKQGCVLG
ncbi:unnamed protein product, partial [Schistocephalus solidus]